MKNIKLFILTLVLSLPLTSFANEKCYIEPEVAQETNQLPGGGNKQDIIKDGITSLQDSVKDLMGCFMMTAYKGPQAIVSECGCKEAIEDNCKFEFSWKGLQVSGKNGAATAWCMPFIFLAY